LCARAVRMKGNWSARAACGAAAIRSTAKGSRRGERPRCQLHLRWRIRRVPPRPQAGWFPPPLPARRQTRSPGPLRRAGPSHRQSGVRARTQPIIDGANSSSPPITLLNAHNVTVSNLAIQNASRLILVEDGSNIKIRNCTLMNASLYGIDMKRTTAFTVSNNTYTTTGSFSQAMGGAIRISAQVTGVKVTGNEVTFNAGSKAGIGIYILRH
jgi:parallel beta-helix repeat protein